MNLILLIIFIIIILFILLNIYVETFITYNIYKNKNNKNSPTTYAFSTSDGDYLTFTGRFVKYDPKAISTTGNMTSNADNITSTSLTTHNNISTNKASTIATNSKNIKE